MVRDYCLTKLQLDVNIEQQTKYGLEEDSIQDFFDTTIIVIFAHVWTKLNDVFRGNSRFTS